MDIIQKTYDILKRHLELSDNWYNNPYVPKEKVAELLKELQDHVSASFKMGKTSGQKEILCGTMELFDKIVEVKKQELNLREDEVRSVKSYFNWEREFIKKST